MFFGIITAALFYFGFLILNFLFYQKKILNEAPRVVHYYIIAILFSLHNLTFSIGLFFKRILVVSDFTTLIDFGVSILKSGELSLIITSILIARQLLHLTKIYREKVRKRADKNKYSLMFVNNYVSLGIYSITISLLIFYGLNDFNNILVSVLSYIILFIFDDFTILSKYESQSNLKIDRFDKLKIKIVDIVIIILITFSLFDYYINKRIEVSLIGSFFLMMTYLFLYLKYNKKHTENALSKYMITKKMSEWQQAMKATGPITFIFLIFLVLSSIFYTSVFEAYHCSNLYKTQGIIITEPKIELGRNGNRVYTKYEYNVGGQKNISSKIGAMRFLLGFYGYDKTSEIESKFEKGKIVDVYYSAFNPQYSILFSKKESYKYILISLLFVMLTIFIIKKMTFDNIKEFKNKFDKKSFEND